MVCRRKKLTKEGKIMVYKCENCSFLFESDLTMTQCPDCGKTAIRPAEESECEEYWNFQKEFHPERFSNQTKETLHA